VYREIASGVYCMEEGKGITRSNVYFVQSGYSRVLIDAASANCGRLIRKTAESLLGANARPASILLTHTHPDHAGSALELARMWSCPVYVHPDELPLADYLIKFWIYNEICDVRSYPDIAYIRVE